MKRRDAAGSTVALTGLLALLLAGCRDAPRTEAPRVDTTARDSVTQAGGEFRPGIRFHPATLRPGASVGELVADSLIVNGPGIDSSYYGVAWFRGQIELSGWTLRHPDADQHHVALCFEADSASAARLPRWLGDERRPWFCFGNRAVAARALGPPSEGIPATIVIERFAIWRGGSDEVNNASFVRLVRGGATPPDSSAP